MKVVLLAAGVGRRFGRRTKTLPKCLIPLDPDNTVLLSRYFDAFRSLGLTDIVIVVGHQREKIRRACRKSGHGLHIRFIFNRDYRKGSIVSLYSAREELNKDCLIMDADVFFLLPALKRLVRSRRKTSFLVDKRAESTGEEMMLMAKADRLYAISKRVDPGLRVVGESIGFLKIGRSDVLILRGILARLVREGNTNAEYEAAYDLLMKKRKVSAVAIGKSFWTEMDFEEDLRKIKAYLGRLKP